jgi:hypothetical protein
MPTSAARRRSQSSTTSTDRGVEHRGVIFSIRSPLLSALPIYTAPGRYKRIAFRGIFWASLAIAGSTLWIQLRREALGESSIAQLLYQLHDQVFLRLKGYTYTLFFPTSLIWYGIAGLLFGLWLLFFLADRSLVRQPHMWLLRFVVGQSWLHKSLVAGARRFLRLGIPSDLLQAIVEHQHTLALEAFTDEPVNKPKRLIQLTTLLIELRLLRQTRSDTLRAACIWQATLLLLRCYGVDKIPPRFLSYGKRLSEPVLRTVSLTPEAALSYQQIGLDITSVMADMLRHYVLLSEEPNPRISQLDPQHAVPSRDQIRKLLLQSAEQRRWKIDQLRGYLEALLTRLSPPEVVPGLAAFGFAPDVDDAELPLLGALALRGDLLTALEILSVDVALGSIEAIEALAVIVDCLSSEILSPDLTVLLRHARSWVREVPSAQDYQLAASLAAQENMQQWRSLEQYATEIQDVIQPADVELASERVDIMFQAAGVDPDQQRA